MALRSGWCCSVFLVPIGYCPGANHIVVSFGWECLFPENIYFCCFLCASDTRNISMSRANQMARVDSRTMLVFGGFASKPGTVTFEESLRFVKKVKVCWIGESNLHGYLTCLLTSHELASTAFDVYQLSEFWCLQAFRPMKYRGYPSLLNLDWTVLWLFDMIEFLWQWDYLNCYVIAISKLNC